MFDQRAMRDMMRQAQQMQAKMEETQAALAQETIQGSAGGGMVTAVVTGQLDLASLTINREVVDPDDVEMLQDLILSAVRDALDKAKALQQERLGAVTGGLQLPF